MKTLTEYNEERSHIETARYSDFGGVAKVRADRNQILDMHKIPKWRQEKSFLEVAGADTDFYRTTAAKGTDRTHTDIAEWLPAAAEKYLISASLSDYVIVPVPLVPSDLPNRNLVAFPFSKLTEFNPSLGMMQYRSWKAAPSHIEHINKDYTKAKGVVFDVSMAKMRSSVDEVWKVIALCGFDRTKDPMLANAILTGERDEYSMGAYVNGYTCSCCGSFTERPHTPSCAHVHPKRQRLNIFEVKGQPTLAYYNVESFKGFEVSSVADGAWRGAKNNKIISV